MRFRFATTTLLAIALLIIPALPLQAAETSLSVTSASGVLGQQVDITISIENPSGLAGGSFNLYYDPDTLQPTGVVAGEVLKNIMLETNSDFQNTQGTAVRAVWAGTRGVQTGGILCNIKFKLLQNGTSPLNLGEMELFDSNLKPISATISNGTLVAGTGQKPVNPPAEAVTGGGSDSTSAIGSQTPSGSNTNGIPPFTGGSQLQTGQNPTQQELYGQQQPVIQGLQGSQVPAVPGQKVETTLQQGSGTTVKASFKDTGKHWAVNYIQQMAQARIMSGYPDGSFQPDKNITRSEFSRVIAVAMKLQLDQQAQLLFDDHEEIEEWARPSIAAAVKAGIISGYSDGCFGPNKNITRAEMAVIIARASKVQVENGATITFADAKQVPVWARPYVASAVKAGIISGKENNRFAPLDPATRAEAACMIAQLLKK